MRSSVKNAFLHATSSPVARTLKEMETKLAEQQAIVNKFLESPSPKERPSEEEALEAQTAVKSLESAYHMLELQDKHWQIVNSRSVRRLRYK